MTVRVNKSSFNIREKLSELGRKFGLKGSELAAAETIQEAREVVSAGRKNLIFNGDFRINQRYGNSSSTEKDRVTVDRWFESNPGGAGMSHQTVQEAPDGFVYSEKMTMGGSVYTPGSTNTMFFSHSIEGQNVAHLNMGSSSAKSFTVSFWVRSSLTGNFSIGINNTTGSNPAYNATHAYVTQYSINSPNTWEYKTITFPGAPIGTWATDNTGGLCLIFDLGSGSGHDGTLNQWSASDNFRAPNSVRMGSVASSTWQITGVQLEVGRNATEFEHRPYTEELVLCQRYYEKFLADDGNGGYATFCHGGKSNNTVIVIEPVFRVPKRAVGAAITWGGSIRFGGVGGVYGITITSANNSQLGKHGGYVVLVISSNSNPANGNDGYRLEGNGDPNAYIAFSSEL